ncbi:hypothetical protein ACFX13_025620 [Malus domestica]
MGLCTPPPNHVVKKFRLKMNNLLFGHEDSVQNLDPYQGRALVRKAKLGIHPIYPTSGLTTRELKVDRHNGK